MGKYTKEFLALCKSVTAKRPRTVIEHILKYGHISTEELKNKYGYNHPPRAARDVKEHGLPLERFTVVGSDGRKIAAYRFADPSTVRFRRLTGRTGLSKKIKDALIDKYGCKCFIYLEEMESQELQIDHRIPFEVGGDPGDVTPENFMLLCGSANRAKSWACEHCENWKNLKDKTICRSCYWAYPEEYTHVAMQAIRRLDLIWQGSEAENYDRLKDDAKASGLSISEYVKAIINKALKSY